MDRANRADLGILVMSVAMLIAPTLDVIAKLLTASISPGQITASRFAFQTMFLAVILAVRSSRPGRLTGLHVIGGSMIGISVLLLVWSLKYLPVSTAIAIFFLEPLLLVILSYLVLGEPLNARRVTAIIAGFGGALLIIRPNWEAFGWIALLPLGSAICFASYVICTKKIATKVDHVASQFWIGSIAFVLFLLVTVGGTAMDVRLFELSHPDFGAWMWMAAMGGLAGAIHVAITVAITLTQASVLAPFQYLEIIGATVLGFLVFANWPDMTTWIGVFMIVGAGLYVFRQEQKGWKLSVRRDQG